MNEDEMMMMMGGEEAPVEDTAPSAVTPEAMMENYQTMAEDEQTAVMQLFDDPVRDLLDKLMGGSTFSTFADQVQGPVAEEAPAEETAGLMGPTPDMETPMPALAAGGDINAQLRDMARQGMSRDQILSKMR